MDETDDTTRREVLQAGAALGVAATGLGVVGTAAAGNGKEFGRVYANGVLWRTNVVTVLDDRPDPEDKIYSLSSGAAVLGADYVEVTLGRPADFGPPNFFICPLNGRA